MTAAVEPGSNGSNGKSTTNGKKNGKDAQAALLYTWPTFPGAAKRMGCTVADVHRAVTQGLPRHLDADGTARFSPVELDEWKETGSLGQVPPVMLNEPTMRQSVDMARQAQGFLAEFVRITIDPIRENARLQQEEITALRARCRELEAAHTDLIRAREALLNQQHERALATDVVSKKEARKDKVFGVFTARLPKLVQQVEASIVGKDPKASAQITAAVDLLKSIDPAMLSGLLELDLFDDKQKGLVRRILNPDAPDEPPASPATVPAPPIDADAEVVP